MLAAALFLASGLSLALWAQEPQAVVPTVIESASKAMGVAGLQSIRYSGTGSTFLVGQAASPGGPWPWFELANYVASVNYAGPAMREETANPANEPSAHRTSLCGPRRRRAVLRARLGGFEVVPVMSAPTFAFAPPSRETPVHPAPTI